MTDTKNMFLHRRSVRRYTSEPVTEEELKTIIACGLCAPSGHGRYAGELVAVTDRAVLEKLAGSRTGSANMLKEAGAAVVVIGSETSDTWVEDCSAVMENMHQACDMEELGSCWIQGRNRTAEDGRTSDEYVREIIGYPEDRHLEAILAVGHPAVHPQTREETDLKWNKVSRNTYGKEF